MEVKATSTGKNPKKVTLESESGSTEPRTTIWEDDPSYESAIVGAYIEGTIDKKDSGTPIPAHPGKNYVNRTFRTGGDTPQAPKSDLEGRVKALEEWRNTFKNVGTPSKAEIAYPEEENNPDDIPF